MSVTTENVYLSVPNTVSITKRLSETAAKIAFYKFQWRYVTLVVFNTTMLGVEDFLLFYDKSAVISTGLDKPQAAENTDQFVVFGQDIEDITYMLDWMRIQQFDNTGRYIVICESNIQENCDATEAINTFWYHKITNVVLIKQSGNKVSGYTYFYSEKNCGMSDPVEVPNLEYCVDNIVGYECDLFPEKFKNLHGCPLIASTFEQPPYMTLQGRQPQGCDGDLLLILADVLNCTLQVMTPHRGDGWGALDPKNGTWTGSLADIYYDLANFSMTSAALTQSRFSSFQTSYNYNFVVIGWVTRPTQLETASLKLIHPFKRLARISVNVAFIFVVILALFVRSSLWTRVMRKPDADTPTLVFYSWMICMGIPAVRLPQKSFYLHMTFLWIMYTFLVRTMYQASLINSLKTNVYLANIDTIEQAIDLNYKIGGGHALRDYFKNYPLVYDRFIGMNSTELVKTLHRVSKGEKSVISVNLEAINIFNKRHGTSLHTVAQRILVSPTAIFFKKFSPLADPMNFVLGRLFEAGIPDYLYRKYVHVVKNNPKTVGKKEPMRTVHFTGCYAILILGWAVSIISFFLEICFGARKKLFIL